VGIDAGAVVRGLRELMERISMIQEKFDSPALIAPEVVRKLQDTALQVYSALKLRDYGRVDMRLSADGRIYVIEANPNPWLAPEGELAIAAGIAGRTYRELIRQIVELALARYAA
jgi:D-alanine-D-alanine ligase-like ATP-grasp enzyme